METKRFLPIGTIVKIKHVDEEIMIIGFLLKDNKGLHDYCGCLYSQGITNDHNYILFNRKDIENVYRLGILDIEGRRFLKKMNELSESGRIGEIWKTIIFYHLVA